MQELSRKALNDFKNVFGSYDEQLMDSLLLTCEEVMTGCEVAGMQHTAEECCAETSMTQKPLFVTNCFNIFMIFSTK